MSIHRPHPLTGPWPYEQAKPRMDGLTPGLVDREPVEGSVIYDDPSDAVLFDGCERCAQHASHPTESLDDENLAALWAEMVRVETDPTFTAHYRTATEGQACRALNVIARFVERTHLGIDPWVWPWSLQIEGAAVGGGFPLAHVVRFTDDHRPVFTHGDGHRIPGVNEEGWTWSW